MVGSYYFDHFRGNKLTTKNVYYKFHISEICGAFAALYFGGAWRYLIFMKISRLLVVETRFPSRIKQRVKNTRLGPFLPPATPKKKPYGRVRYTHLPHWLLLNFPCSIVFTTTPPRLVDFVRTHDVDSMIPDPSLDRRSIVFFYYYYYVRVRYQVQRHDRTGA